MPDQAAAIGASGLKAAYRERTPGSARLYAEALVMDPTLDSAIKNLAALESRGGPMSKEE